MKLIDTLTEDNIIIPLNSNSRDEAIAELVEHLKKQNIISQTDEVISKVLKRESKLCSAAGRGVAYPHAVSNEIFTLKTIVGISPTGIDYNSPDTLPCHIILLTISPESKVDIHRKFLSIFRTMINNSMLRSEIIETNSAKEIRSLIEGWEIRQEEEEVG
jgi:fructose PTS system EIIBC or EIIC component